MAAAAATVVELVRVWGEDAEMHERIADPQAHACAALRGILKPGTAVPVTAPHGGRR